MLFRSAGQYIKRVKPDFDVRSYGFKKLAQFVEAFPKRYKIKKKSTIIYYKRTPCSWKTLRQFFWGCFYWNWLRGAFALVWNVTIWVYFSAFCIVP